MAKPVISVMHHKSGVSAAVVHGEDPAAYWTRVNGYGEGDGEQWLESFGLEPPFSAASELLEALKQCVFALNVKAKFRCGDTDSYAIASVADEAIRKAEGKVK